MNILFLNSETIKLFDLPWAFIEAGHTVDSLATIYKFNEHIKETDELLINKLSEKKYDFVMTYDFLPVISDICNQMNIKYVSWTFDSPLYALYTPAARNSCNYVFVFDKGQYKRLEKMGIPHLFHLPMAINKNRISAIDITEEDEKKFQSDISFVGNLYQDNLYNQIFPYLTENNRQYFEQILSLIFNNISEKNIESYVGDETVTFLNNALNSESKNKFLMTDRYYYADNLFSRKVSEMDRVAMLNRLGKKFQVRLYTNNDTSMIQNVELKPAVSYESDMNKVFYLSKININQTIRSIETGLPLRIFDIMGSGGFLLTNYQEELEDYFEIDEDLVVYRSFDELEDKCRYYLTHEEERVQILINGYKKVCQNHTYGHRVEQILQCMK
ncbi:MAG: glycosyltransferase [Lachnospiraceae bacterium]|nr:glycosyltransferase [Lachnospiraceae bacterium]